MDYEEREVRMFLRGYPGQFVNPRIISRRVGGKRRYHDDPYWVTPILNKLLEQGVVEMDEQGHFRLKKRDIIDRRKRTWVSPQVRRVLERSKVDVSKVFNLDEDEDEELGEEEQDAK